MNDPATPPLRRRDLLSLIGAAAGGAAMYQAMTSLGFAAESPYRGPIKLEGDPKGASVVILGAGLAGMTAAFELRRVGYKVELLEYRWLRVSGTTEMPQIDQCVGHQFHTVVSLLFELEAQQQPLEFIFPREGPLHA